VSLCTVNPYAAVRRKPLSDGFILPIFYFYVKWSRLVLVVLGAGKKKKSLLALNMTSS
jgi:hypothetical protein